MLIFHASDVQFRTGWFMESVVSATLIVLVIRSQRPFFKSKPRKYLSIATACVAAAALILPYTPIAGILGFAGLPVRILPAIFAVIVLYILIAEIAKKCFYRIVKD